MTLAAGLNRTGWLALAVLCATSASVLAVILHDWWTKE